PRPGLGTQAAPPSCTTESGARRTESRNSSRAGPEGPALLEKYVRRRPTLPQPLGCSTIGAERLNFRVRNGAGCFPFAMAAVTLWNSQTKPHPCCGGFCGLVVVPEPHSGRVTSLRDKPSAY